jgi:membrane protease YdiL (CAAX protease family)
MNISNIIALAAPQSALSRILSVVESFCHYVETMSAGEIIAAAGLVLFAVWIIKTSWGTKALLDAPQRPNTMPPYLPLIVIFAWYMLSPLAFSLAEFLLPELPEWQEAGVRDLVMCLCGITISATTILLAKQFFENGLKGFGLNFRTIHKDLPAAVLNLFCVWPLVMTAFLITEKLGTMIWGPDFKMSAHEQIELIGLYSQWSLRILIFIVAAIIAPLVEELVFRGMFQTTIRSIFTTMKYPQPAWLSIGASSVLFAASHANAGHMPSLFVLSICMGYSYEKSGSLFRPILIHAMFNGMNVLAVLLAQPS